MDLNLLRCTDISSHNLQHMKFIFSKGAYMRLESKSILGRFGRILSHFFNSTNFRNTSAGFAKAGKHDKYLPLSPHRGLRWLTNPCVVDFVTFAGGRRNRAIHK